MAARRDTLADVMSRPVAGISKLPPRDPVRRRQPRRRAVPWYLNPGYGLGPKTPSRPPNGGSVA
jgi:hypothetical protein